ncbi:hypothetical protein JOC78_002264 [Bacillus ectoiniformans]|uniref:trypsin-like peptidase domain-containing protein n=1 Tax=Bacillus ectoiniformans TaxID=1494429 RepID=UPI00195D4FCF|nr:trypsin-like peptidase domain-containing protein [Bacillus ectoiniformans]MBM7649311.1 hypothetical protein [Bacillus ectoiniformans]
MFQQTGKEEAKTAISPTQVKKEEPAPPPTVIKQVVAPPKDLTKEEQKALTEIIADTQKKVYTIFADGSQGSGFLINKKGDVVTNAHVVEGATSVTVKDLAGKEHSGKIIGYSNNTDVAVIRVAALAGKTPLQAEKSSKAKVGEEVIALGSPLALENTATFGYITGVDRSFFIGSRSYDGIYQTSAAIAPGSSGGPLVSKKSGKVLAINSAKMNGQDAIGFSIPMKDINEMIQGWIKNPLTEEELYSLFYNDNGGLYYQEFWDDEAYFDGGEYSDEESYDYYDVPDEWTEEEYGEEYEDSETYEEEYNEDETYDEEYDESYDDSYDAPADYEESYEEPPVEEEIIEEETPSEDEELPTVEDINGDGMIDVNDLEEDLNGDGLIDENDLIFAGIQP